MVDLVVAVMTVGRERTLAPFRLELTQGRDQVDEFCRWQEERQVDTPQVYV